MASFASAQFVTPQILTRTIDLHSQVIPVIPRRSQTSLGTGSSAEESLLFLDFRRREIPRFARNDRPRIFCSALTVRNAQRVPREPCATPLLAARAAPQQDRVMPSGARPPRTHRSQPRAAARFPPASPLRTR